MAEKFHFKQIWFRGYVHSKKKSGAIRGGTLRPSPSQLCIGSWNVEGLTEAKLITLETYMHDYGIHLLCLQEVRKSMSEYSITEAGFLLICSGGQNTLEYAGLGSWCIHFCESMFTISADTLTELLG